MPGKGIVEKAHCICLLTSLLQGLQGKNSGVCNQETNRNLICASEMPKRDLCLVFVSVE